MGTVLSERIKGTGFYEGFDDAFVDGFVAGAYYEVVKALVGAIFASFGDNEIGSAFADAFDGGEAEADAGSLVFKDGSKGAPGDIDVGTEDGKAHGAALVEEVGDFIGISLLRTQNGRHEFDRVIGFEVGGAVAEHRIGGRVGFVEAVLCEFLKKGKDGLGGLAIDIIGFLGTGNEDVFLGVHYFLDLFTHRPAKDIGTPKGITGNDLGGLHNLLLINEDTVGFLHQFFEKRMGHLYGLGILFALDELINELHGAGSIQCDQGDDFFK